MSLKYRWKRQQGTPLASARIGDPPIFIIIVYKDGLGFVGYIVANHVQLTKRFPKSVKKHSEAAALMELEFKKFLKKLKKTLKNAKKQPKTS